LNFLSRETLFTQPRLQQTYAKPLQSLKAKSLWRIGLIVLFTASQLTQKANAIAVATPTHHSAQSKTSAQDAANAQKT
jgi:hypothetical protein